MIYINTDFTLFTHVYCFLIAVGMNSDNDVFVAVISFYGKRRKLQGAHTGK
jgi:hypothetical protein